MNRTNILNTSLSNSDNPIDSQLNKPLWRRPFVLAPLGVLAAVVLGYGLYTGLVPQQTKVATVQNVNRGTHLLQASDSANLTASSSASLQSSPSAMLPAKPGLTSYASTAHGIGFYYTPNVKYGDQKITPKVVETGNRIDIYPLGTVKPGQSQYVEVFSKDPADTLDQAITKTFLTGYDTSVCHVGPAQKDDYPLPSNYVTASILLPPPSPENKPVNCPTPYAATGGIYYFLMDVKHPSKFLFFNIGQYPIDAGNGTQGYPAAWQDTITFTN